MQFQQSNSYLAFLSGKKAPELKYITKKKQIANAESA